MEKKPSTLVRSQACGNLKKHIYISGNGLNYCPSCSYGNLSAQHLIEDGDQLSSIEDTLKTALPLIPYSGLAQSSTGLTPPPASRTPSASDAEFNISRVAACAPTITLSFRNSEEAWSADSIIERSRPGTPVIKPT